MEISRDAQVKLLKILVHYKTLLDALNGRSKIVDDEVLDQLLLDVEEAINDDNDDFSHDGHCVIDYEESEEDPGYWAPVFEKPEEEKPEEPEENYESLLKDVEYAARDVAHVEALEKLPRIAATRDGIAFHNPAMIFFERASNSFIIEEKGEQFQIIADFVELTNSKLSLGEASGDIVTWTRFALDNNNTGDYKAWRSLLDSGAVCKVIW